jgi:tetratricopeptide (TPR) repeat protein
MAATSERLTELLQFVQMAPSDPFPLYGLAMEHKSLGNLAEAAQAFERLGRDHPSYVPQYLLYGKLLAGELGDREKAMRVLKTGIEAAQRARNLHALGELRAELEQLESAGEE